MTCVELSHATLLAKASLTGIIDRLEAKELVERQVVPNDRRATNIRLTRKGENLHRKVFPAQVNRMRPYFQQALTKQEIIVLQGMLKRLRNSCLAEASL